MKNKEKIKEKIMADILNQCDNVYFMAEKKFDYLCKCNNCGEVLIDKNPMADAIKYELEPGMKSLKMIFEAKDPENFYWGCPNCFTDAYLDDNFLETT